MDIRIPEGKRLPGVCYAPTDEGWELPVIDLTHAAFSSRPSEEELSRLATEALASTRKWLAMPAVVRWLVTRFVMRRGVLTGALARSRGSYLAGLATYLLKLGPQHLGPWATPIAP